MIAVLVLSLVQGLADGLQSAARPNVQRCPSVASTLSSPRVGPSLDLPSQEEIPFPLTVPLGLHQSKGPSEYELNMGRVVDTLRHDYPLLFTQKPDLSIMDSEIELHDPTGKRLQGIRQYTAVFDMLRFLRRTTMQDAEISYRLVVCENTVRVRWTAKVWMRDPALGYNTFNGAPVLVHLDGISEYDLNDRGLVRAHRLEDIVMTGGEREAVQLQFAWPVHGMATPEMAMPFFRTLSDALPGTNELAAPVAPGGPKVSPRSPGPTMSVQNDEASGEADQGNWLDKLAGGLNLPKPCATSYDCDSPTVCCDLLFTTVCCDGGMLIPTTDPLPQAIPIPVPVDPYPNLPVPRRRPPL